MLAKVWRLPPSPSPERDTLARALGVAPVVAGLLIARGCTEERAARRFLDPHLDHCHDPLLLPDMASAAARLARAVREREAVLVHGDYDVDGVCAAALLTRALRTLAVPVTPFIPHRQRDGYDLSVETVRRAAAEGFRLILTADCGSIAFEAAEAARDLGVDLIVTDHHEAQERLPPALAVVNPKRRDGAYPFPDLCGAAVAYKLIWATLRELGLPEGGFRKRYLDLVALATAADCVPLLDENRALVKHGLHVLADTRKPGLRALMRVAGVDPRFLTVRHLAFALGPRINAVGRLGAATQALELLLMEDNATASALAERLDEVNQVRQEEQERILQDATRQALRYIDDRILVLASPRWHPGIIGIVASKMVELHGRPAVLVAIDEEAGVGRGSARSISGYHIFQALDACRSLLIRCGGHQTAAGFDVDAACVEALRSALQEVAAQTLSDGLLEPAIHIDAMVPAAAVTLRLADELACLEPFGHGNHEPVLYSGALDVVRCERLAARAKGAQDHLRLYVRPQGAPGAPVEAVLWRGWERASEIPAGGRLDLCYTLGVNAYQGLRAARLDVKDLRPAGQTRK
ncbi:MAG: single-stranded-DNA-specific exonuclease RecJ [Armatimonadetes bacterium]|nr:single-stranded-DNA-specific exonuclease RecJ [Armatimonadota bacterium]